MSQPSADGAHGAAADSGIVIIGGGAAGTACAQAISAAGAHATLIDARERAVELPPLSKSLFADALDLTELPRELPGIDVLTGRVDDVGERALTLADGRSVGYATLVIATGLSPLPAPAHLPEASLIHGHEDAHTFRASLVGGTDLGILGSGFLALEAARGAADAGFSPTVHLRGARPLTGLHPLTVDAVVALHEAAGVRFIPFEPDPQTAQHDHWLVAIGAAPELPQLPQGWQHDELGYIEVDAGLRIIGAGGRAFAIGDCAHVVRGPMSDYPPSAAESVALSQGAWLGAALAGAQPLPGPSHTSWEDVPWHWSFQGPVRIFTAGQPAASAHPEAVVTGDLAAGRGQVLLFASAADDAPLIGAETLGAPPAHNAAKRALASGRVPTRSQASAAGFELRTWQRSQLG